MPRLFQTNNHKELACKIFDLINSGKYSFETNVALKNILLNLILLSNEPKQLVNDIYKKLEERGHNEWNLFHSISILNSDQGAFDKFLLEKPQLSNLTAVDEAISDALQANNKQAEIKTYRAKLPL